MVTKNSKRSKLKCSVFLKTNQEKSGESKKTFFIQKSENCFLTFETKMEEEAWLLIAVKVVSQSKGIYS
jgi:hypothetical protein